MKSRFMRISLGLVVLTALLFSLIPPTISHAGLVPDEEPVTATSSSSTGVTSSSSSGSWYIQVKEHAGRSLFPLVDGYVVYPGSRQWTFRLFLDKDTCFLTEKHVGVDYLGNRCIP